MEQLLGCAFTAWQCFVTQMNFSPSLLSGQMMYFVVSQHKAPGSLHHTDPNISVPILQPGCIFSPAEGMSEGNSKRNVSTAHRFLQRSTTQAPIVGLGRARNPGSILPKHCWNGSVRAALPSPGISSKWELAEMPQSSLCSLRRGPEHRWLSQGQNRVRTAGPPRALLNQSH